MEAAVMVIFEDCVCHKARGHCQLVSFRNTMYQCMSDICCQSLNKLTLSSYSYRTQKHEAASLGTSKKLDAVAQRVEIQTCSTVGWSPPGGNLVWGQRGSGGPVQLQTTIWKRNEIPIGNQSKNSHEMSVLRKVKYLLKPANTLYCSFILPIHHLLWETNTKTTQQQGFARPQNHSNHLQSKTASVTTRNPNTSDEGE